MRISCNQSKLVVWGLVAVLFGVTAGCGSRGGGQVVEGEEGIKQAAKIYGKFMSEHRGQGPKNEQEWNAFIQKLSKDDKTLKEMGIEDLNKALTSPRDNEKYVLVYGQSANMSTMNPNKDKGKMGTMRRPIAMYEKVGSGGKRYVVYAMGGGFQEVTEQEFRELVPDAK